MNYNWPITFLDLKHLWREFFNLFRKHNFNLLTSSTSNTRFFNFPFFSFELIMEICEEFLSLINKKIDYNCHLAEGINLKRKLLSLTWQINNIDRIFAKDNIILMHLNISLRSYLIGIKIF